MRYTSRRRLGYGGDMDVQTLRRHIRGEVVQRSDASYEAVRRALVWNELKPERHPQFIVRAASDSDVVAAIAFARAHSLRVAVRGGGHSWCGAALRDGGMLLDLGHLDQVSIDPAARVATVQPVVRNRDLARQLAVHGLAFPLGHCSTVALSGYLLGGGFGWNAGTWGPACFSVRSLDVVTADGRLRRVDAENDPDLFWAARGAGAGFFGVVTRFELQVYPLPRAITTNTYVHRLERLADVIEWITTVGPALPPNVELVLVLGAAPGPAAPLYRDSNGMACTVMATAFVDTVEQAADALAPLEDSRLASDCVWKEANRPTPFDVLFNDLDQLFPEKHRYLADALWSNAAPADVIGALRDQLLEAPSRQSLVLCIVPPPPHADAPPLPDAAFSMTGRVFILSYAIWPDAQDDAANLAWHRQTLERLAPYASGHYVGESDIVATPSRAADSFAPANWERLQALCSRYDPDGLFHSFLGQG